jgi:hypothetical protein
MYGPYAAAKFGIALNTPKESMTMAPDMTANATSPTSSICLSALCRTIYAPDVSPASSVSVVSSILIAYLMQETAYNSLYETGFTPKMKCPFVSKSISFHFRGTVIKNGKEKLPKDLEPILFFRFL